MSSIDSHFDYNCNYMFFLFLKKELQTINKTLFDLNLISKILVIQNIYDKEKIKNALSIIDFLKSIWLKRKQYIYTIFCQQNINCKSYINLLQQFQNELTDVIEYSNFLG